MLLCQMPGRSQCRSSYIIHLELEPTLRTIRLKKITFTWRSKNHKQYFPKLDNASQNSDYRYVSIPKIIRSK